MYSGDPAQEWNKSTRLQVRQFIIELRVIGASLINSVTPLNLHGGGMAEDTEIDAIGT